mmetsp:Transcript_33372/g.69501  ORF Transcript_33372/g.69501 Transcript_33372/m.69501 type:complete len:670 (-) Transcript_33372:2206-4215(-)
MRGMPVGESSRGRRTPSSSPFLRKPMPQMREEPDVVTLADNTTSDGNNRLQIPGLFDRSSSSTSRARGLESRPSYASIPGDDDNIIDNDSSSQRVQNVSQSPSSTSLERHLTLLDLIAVGIGGTVGSGLFVLAGLVANQYAGPSTVCSWLVSGLTACLSGFCYAELSSRIPLAGGSYAYNYVAHGELFAVLAAACLSLEYIAASAAVARSWGDKVCIWLLEDLDAGDWVHDWLDPSATFSPLAGLLSATTVGLLLAGVKESKAATNFFTVLKLIVVSVMVLGALYYVKPENWTPFCPYGVGGVVRGATGTFFGYLGYDQVTALAGEAKNAKHNLPRAIIGVLIGVMILYMSATLFLTGMQPYLEISPVSGFPAAFRSVGANFVAEFVSFGEIATLPIVILVTIMAQPRLQYAMAVDGLLPPVFGKIDSNGNLWNGTFVAGSVMTIVSACVPFENLNDMISCAVLTVLALTDSSVVMLWHEGTERNPRLPGQLMGIFHLLALVSGVVIVNFLDMLLGKVIATIGVFGMMFTCYAIHRWCPRSETFGGHRPHYHEDELRKDDGYFKTPCVPLLPCVAVAVNWYLIAQLDMLGVCSLMGFLALTVAYYFFYASHHSVGNNGGWESSSHRDEIELERNISQTDLSVAKAYASQSDMSSSGEDGSSDESTHLKS